MMPTVFVVLVAVALSGATPLGPCNYDGHLYAAGELITIPHCLATIRCLGNDVYGDRTELGGICPDKREAGGLTGCYVDGKHYAKGERIITQPCLAMMTCLGDSVLSDITMLSGVCPDKREADGQTGCYFDGRVYKKGDTIIIGKCEAKFDCLGDNLYSDSIELRGIC